LVTRVPSSRAVRLMLRRIGLVIFVQ
jgi:hypothetical protein